MDTCGWIEWFTDGHLASNYESYLMHPDQLIIPTIIQYELFKWISREKDSTAALEVIGITERGTVVSLDTDIALYAYDILLITSDKHFKNLPQVKFFEKK